MGHNENNSGREVHGTIDLAQNTINACNKLSNPTT